jgi:hypothetical protein
MTGRSNDGISAAKVAAAIAGGFALAWLGCLVLMLRDHVWVIDVHGKPIVTDFLAFWVAGRETLGASAATVYDPRAFHAAQVAEIGHEFRVYLLWLYPPVFFLVVALLGFFSYLTAFLIWVACTLAAFAATVSAITRSRVAAVLACSAPPVFLDSVAGQNGLLTAFLVGTSLLLLEKRPLMSGCLIGLLSYKPQFAILIPVVLACSGNWRAFATAGLSSALCLLASWRVLGAGTWAAFFHFLPLESHEMLVLGDHGWNKLQTLYGLCRWLGLGAAPAWSAQALLGLCALAAVAAALSAATLLATPYLYMYDLPVLVLPLVFLFRHRAFDTVELAGMGFAFLCLLAFTCGVFVIPIGPFAVAAICALIARRSLAGAPTTVSETILLQGA